MKNIIKKGIAQIEKLIQLKICLKNIYNEENDNLDKKELTESKQLDFKIKNYKKWIVKLKELNEEYDNNVSIKELKTLKLSDGLMKRLEEINDEGEIHDIGEVKKKLYKLTNNNSDKKQKRNDDTTTDSDDSFEYEKKKKKMPKKKLKTSNDIDFDIETILKKKGMYVKPENKLEQNIFNLELIHGIGPKNAKKLAELGLTLELLRKDWDNMIKKNPLNSILMLEQIKPIPDEYRLDDRIVSQYHKRASIDLENRLSKTKHLKHLKHEQLVGLKYFEDIQKRIPRIQIEGIEKTLRYVCDKLDKDLIFVICGSYRRGKETSGDVDMLLTHKKFIKKDNIEKHGYNPLKKLVNILTKVGFLVDHLTIDGNHKYMGLCKLEGFLTARRIDIRFVPYDCLAASMLYFTGSKNFNTEMRRHAISKGYTLNEYGLYKVSKEGTKTIKQIVPARTEKKLFDILNYKYLEPVKRDF